MRIVIIEDHLMFREVLRKVCAVDLQLEVVGEAGDGEAAIALVTKLRPELVLLDLHLPKLDGIAVAEAIHELAPEIRILVLSSHCDEYTVFRVERAHVQGFVDKNTNSVTALKEAIAAVMQGRTSFSDAFTRVKNARLRDPQSFDKVLTSRERAILALVGEPMSDEEIGRRLEIATETVEKHRYNLMRKLEVRSTVELMRYARAHGFTLSAPRGGDGATLP